MHSKFDGSDPVSTSQTLHGERLGPLVVEGASRDAVDRTAARLNAGGVIAIPTDTVYGIAASVTDAAAIQRIFAVKRRPADRPLPVLVSSVEALTEFAPALSEQVSRLLNTFWPGPLTVVVRCRRALPNGVIGPGHTIGVRVPDHPLAIAVIEQAGGAIACTSANRSGEPPATSAAHVVTAIGADIDLILDGGEAPGGVPSTVIALDAGALQILREGAISATKLRQVLEIGPADQVGLSARSPEPRR